VSRRSVRSPQDGSALSVPGLRPKPSLYIREETLGKVGEVDGAAVSIVAPIQDELGQAVARIQDSGEDQQVTAFTAAKPKGKREMPHVRMNDHAEPFTSYRRQGLVRDHGPCSKHMLRARLHYPLPYRLQRPLADIRRLCDPRPPLKPQTALREEGACPREAISTPQGAPVIVSGVIVYAIIDFRSSLHD
jgi:hypothetical protein